MRAESSTFGTAERAVRLGHQQPWGVDVHLAELRIRNFRRISDATLKFRPGMNVIVGPNNIGKKAVVDALRALLAGADDPYPSE